MIILIKKVYFIVQNNSIHHASAFHAIVITFIFIIFVILAYCYYHRSYYYHFYHYYYHLIIFIIINFTTTTIIFFIFLRNEESMSSLLSSFRDPLILIISDVCGKDDSHFAAEKCLPQHVRNRYATDQIYYAIYFINEYEFNDVHFNVLCDERKLGAIFFFTHFLSLSRKHTQIHTLTLPLYLLYTHTLSHTHSLSPTIIYSVQFDSIYCQAITERNTLKVLQKIISMFK